MGIDHAEDESSISGEALYFAYGSNMLCSRLSARVPSARPVGPACLKDHRLLFDKRGRDGSGKANALPAAGSRVFGVLFAIADEHLAVLDRAELGYERVLATVHTADGARTAFLYTALPSFRAEGLLPFCWYIALVVDGGREHGLPADYLQTIAEAPYCEDRDGARFRSNQRR